MERISVFCMMVLAQKLPWRAPEFDAHHKHAKTELAFTLEHRVFFRKNINKQNQSISDQKRYVQNQKRYTAVTNMYPEK